MKKYLSILLLVISFIATAQTTVPRYNSASGNQSGANLSYKAYTVTPTTTMVSVPALPSYENCVTIASSSMAPTFTANVGSSYKGDKMTLLVASNSTSRIATFSTGFICATTTITITASKKLMAHYVFDGAKWVEVGRTLEP